MVVGNGVPSAPSLTVPARGGVQGGSIPLDEPRLNVVINGFVTDSTQLVDIWALDFPAGVGAPIPRLLGTVLPEPGGLAGVGKGNKGRFRFTVSKTNLLPATRMYMATTHHGQVQLKNQPGRDGAVLAGLQTGQYAAPMFTFQFADAPPGFPIVPNNFDTMPFLNSGEGSTGPLVPFPPVAP
jgi:hypothetical protein